MTRSGSRRFLAGIDRDKCGYCGACVGVCEQLALSLAEAWLELYEEKCNGCGECVIVCPVGALVVSENK